MRRLALPGGLTGLAVLVTTLALGTAAYPVLGLPDPGVGIRVLAPLLRGAADLAAAACLGAFVHALLLDLRPAGPYADVLRWASRFGAAWSACALATAVLLVADASGGRPEGGDLVVGLLVRAAPLGWVATAVLAALVAVWAREARTPSSAAGAAVVAVVALLGPVVTGHAIDGVGHDLGLPATAMHVVAATLWLSTLGAAAVGGGPGDRVRRICAGCAVVVVATGLVQALVLVGTGSGWVTPYGVLVLVASVITVGAVVVRARRPGPRRLLVELALLGVVLGLSVAMTRAVPPVQAPGLASPSAAVLGYALTEPPTVLTLLTSWRVDLTLTVLAVVLAGLYALGLRRTPGWPRGRAVCWFAACATLVVATSSGLGRYGPAVLSVHVAGHMLVSTVVPFLLVLGGPLTLARRALPDSEGDREGPGEWLEHVVDAPAVRVATHPLVATVALVGSPFLLYLTPLFSLTQPLGWLQPLMNLWFLGVGLMFAWVLVGVDPAPHRLPHVARLAIVLASMPFHALFGVILLGTDAPISQTPSTLTTVTGGGQVFVGDFYQRLRLPWNPSAADLLADQHVAAVLTWAMGDLPLVAIVVVLLVQWQRAAATEDRAARAGLLTGTVGNAR